MKKSSKPQPKSKLSHPKEVPIAEPLVDNAPLGEEDHLAEDQLAVAGREEEASSSGHRVEPIINDEEGNAEKLIEEGLHGYMHRSKKAR